MGNVTKSEAMTGTLKVIKDLGADSRHDIIKLHREYHLTPAQSQKTLHELAMVTLAAWKEQKKNHGVARARQFLDFKIPELCASFWMESLQIDWMTELQEVMPNIGSAEFIAID